MTRRIAIINGPNLNLLGIREPEVYGHQTFDDYLEELRPRFPDCEIQCFQSNHEGAIVDYIQQHRPQTDILIINAGAYTHTSVAIRDAILAVDLPAIEVHLSNIHRREEFRHRSYVSKAATGVICGFGPRGYRMALEAMAAALIESEGA